MAAKLSFPLLQLKSLEIWLQITWPMILWPIAPEFFDQVLHTESGWACF